jgi:hypothetical protein
MLDQVRQQPGDQEDAEQDADRDPEDGGGSLAPGPGW